MRKRSRWSQCVAHYAQEATDFVSSYFAMEGRRVFLVAGAGFDPRASRVAELMAHPPPTEPRLRALFLREERPDPDPELVRRAGLHVANLQTLIANAEVVSIDVLSPTDQAVVGGQRAVQAISAALPQFEGWATDVVLDLSALSIGVAFPLAKYLLDFCEGERPRINLHLVVAGNSAMDNAITSIAGDAVDPIRGFSGAIDLADSAPQPKIWLPHLAPGRLQTLQAIRSNLQGPVDVCPVLPLSTRNARAGDDLMLEYESVLAQDWEVDSRNVVYALEDDPLDLYRTITAIYHRFMGVLEGVIPAHVVLSPSGNKLLSIGALMAALELDLPVRYVEAIQFAVDWSKIQLLNPEDIHLVHVWLAGDAYRYEQEDGRLGQ